MGRHSSLCLKATIFDKSQRGYLRPWAAIIFINYQIRIIWSVSWYNPIATATAITAAATAATATAATAATVATAATAATAVAATSAIAAAVPILPLLFVS